MNACSNPDCKDPDCVGLAGGRCPYLPPLPASLPDVQVEKVELRLTLGATVTVYDGAGQATDWLKPSSEAAVTWRGGIPSESEVKLAYEYMNARNAQALEEVIVAVRSRLDEARRGR